MSTPTDPIADIARVAFVTQRFHELRGLIPAAFGGALIVAALMFHAAGGAFAFGSGAAALALLTRNTDPARAFALLVCAASVGIMIEALFTYRTGTRNADTI